jgi:hypothetical protein
MSAHFIVRPVRRECRLVTADGEFVVFESDCEVPVSCDGDYFTASVRFENIEVLERGNIYDSEGAD